MPSQEYIELRILSHSHDDKLPSDHPCGAGNASCCVSNVPITEEDMEYIQDGVARGEISQEVVDAAIRRAHGKGNKCAFLGEGNLCTIYNRRPLICVATGFLTFANSRKLAEQILSGQRDDLSYNGETTSSMCRSCHRVLGNRRECASRRILEDSARISMYLKGSRNIPIGTFLKKGGLSPTVIRTYMTRKSIR